MQGLVGMVNPVPGFREEGVRWILVVTNAIISPRHQCPTTYEKFHHVVLVKCGHNFLVATIRKNQVGDRKSVDFDV